MARPEEALINAVCENKDVAVLYSGVDEIMGDYKDMWEALKSYHVKYRSLPDIELMQEKFSDLEKVEVRGDTRYYVDELRSAFIKNKMQSIMLKAADDLKTDSPSRVLEKAYADMTKLGRLSNSARDLDLTDTDAAERYITAIAERSRAMGGAPGIRTGVKSIDLNYPTGMAPGHLIVAIGWPAKGKTWFASWLACQAWAQGFHPMIVSLEMSPENMRDRIYTMMGSGLFSASGFSRGDINLDDFRAWGSKTMRDKPPFTIVSTDGMTEMTPAMVEGKVEQHRPDLVIADYHQLFTNNGRSNSPIERAMNISREFKRLAVSREIALIDITAATSDDTSDRDEPPMMSQVAWSKAIEYDADLAFAVHRESDTNLINIVGRKNRFGDLFDFYMDVDLDRGIWKEQF